MPVQSHFFRDSSFIQHVSWDSDFNNLAIQFNTGTVWIYYNVPENVYKSLLKAKSVGAYFNKEIRDNYSSERFVYSSEVKTLGQEKEGS